MTQMSVTRAYLRAARYFREDWGKIVFSTILIGLSTLAKLGQPFPLALLIDCVIPQVRPEKTGDWVHRLFWATAPSSSVAQIVLLAVVMLLLRLLQELIGLWQGMYNLHIFKATYAACGMRAHVDWQGPPVQASDRQQLPITLTLKCCMGTIE